MSKGNIFICYRHEDSSAYAGRLADELGRHFGKEKVFRDAGSQRGVDFRDQIDEAIDSCAVLVAVIGQRWLRVQDESGRRRIDHPTDLVALEIAVALERDIRVIPVLVAGARMPREADLPKRLAGLAYRTAVELNDAGWDHHISGLLGDLNQLLGEGIGTGAAVALRGVSPVAIVAPQNYLDEIHRCITAGTHVVIGGAPGLARRWLLTALHRAYPQAVHVRLEEGKAEPMRELRLALHGRYGTPAFPLDDKAGLDALRRAVDANTLLLVDNADERESVAAVLLLVHVVDRVTVVVTSCRTREFRAFRRLDPPRLPMLDTAAAIDTRSSTPSNGSSSSSSETALFLRSCSSLAAAPAATCERWRRGLYIRAMAYANTVSRLMSGKRGCPEEPGSGTGDRTRSR
jgi:hypothetical protein